MNDTLTKNPEQVLEANNAVKRVSEVLKTQLTTLLDLGNSRADSDND